MRRRQSAAQPLGDYEVITKAIRLYGRDEYPQTLGRAAAMEFPPGRLAVLSIGADGPPPIWHFAALRRLAHRRFAAHPFILDCGDCGGSALEAWARGIEAVVFAGGEAAAAALRRRGKSAGGLLFTPAELPPIFDVMERSPAELEEWLRE